MLLQLLGILFLLLLLAGAYFGWKFYAQYRGDNEDIGSNDLYKAIAVLPEMELILDTADIVDWKSRDQLIEQENALRRLGLQHQGYFRSLSEVAQVQISLWSFKQAIAFVFYEGRTQSQSVHFSYECIARLSDGSTLCVNHSSLSHPLPRPPQHALLKADNAGVAEMLKTLKQNIPAGCKVLPIKDVKKYFIESSEQIHEWLWREEQLRSKQIAALLEPLGIVISDALIAQLVDHGNMLRSQLRSHQIVRKLAASAKVPPGRWEEIRDNLVVVHNDMSAAELVGAIYDLNPDLDDKQEAELDKLAENNDVIPAVEELERLRSTLNISFDAKRLASVNEPVRGEVYLAQ